MRGHYGVRIVGAESVQAEAPKPSSAVPTALLIMGGLAAVVIHVLRDEMRASR